MIERPRGMKTLTIVQIVLCSIILIASPILFILVLFSWIFGGLGGGAFSITEMMYRIFILTLPIYGIVCIVASAKILHSKESGRKLLVIVLCITLGLEIICSIIDFNFLILASLKMLYEAFLLYYFNKQNVKDYFRM